MWDKSFRGGGASNWYAFPPGTLDSLFYWRLASTLLLLFLTAAAIPAHGREKDTLQYGEGLIVNIPLPEPEVAQVVGDVAQNTIIHGTKEYNKDEYVAGAVAASATPAFPAWTEGGKVFYKVREHTLDPRNFKNSGDVGTLAVRYVVQPQGDKNTVLRIDAVFVEEFRRIAHPSNGSVESSEYKDITDRLQALELVKKETEEALEAKQQQLAKKNFGLGSDTEVLSTPPTTAKSSESANGENTAGHATSASTPPSSAYDPSETLEQHVANLRRQVERLVKKPGAPLKSAPFHTASTLTSLEAGAEVLILITTSYWYGVETHDGQHGWLRRDELEQVP